MGSAMFFSVYSVANDGTVTFTFEPSEDQVDMSATVTIVLSEDTKSDWELNNAGLEYFYP